MKLYGTPRKNKFFFFEMFWKDGLAKKSHWNLIFLVLSGSMIFIFPENMILFFRRKMKDDLKKKKYMEIWCFLQMFWKDGLSKKIRTWIWSFFVISGKMVYLSSRKCDIFSLDGKWKMIFIKKYMEIWHFLEKYT